MALPLAPAGPHRTATFVGFVTTVIGTALLVAPEAVGRRSWIEDPVEARILGGVDLAIAGGLLFGRPRSPWMAARVVANVGTAAFFGRIARDGKPGAGTIGPAVVAGALLSISVVDLTVVRALRAEEQAADER